MQRDDSSLVRACLAGEPSAWDELVERYGRLVYSIPIRCGLAASDADDVFQTVFGIVLRQLSSLRDQTRLTAWLIRTTYRECWSVRKRLRGVRSLEQDAIDAAAPADEEVDRLERRQIVRQAMGQLDRRCRELLEALFYASDEPSYDEIAGRLNMKVGSIGPTRARCFRKLEEHLAELGM